MRIIATGDHHWSERSRFDECQRIHTFIAELVERERPDLFLSAGDVYDKASTLAEREAVAEWFARIASVCPVVVARGNHDAVSDLSPINALSPNIIVEEGAAVHRVAGAAVACVAWPRREHLRALVGDAGSEEIDQTGHAVLCDILRGLGNQLAAHDGPRILLSHIQCDGARTSTGQELVGADITVGLADLALARADAVVLGHVHLAQAWDIDGCPVIYTGSPYRRNFGESEGKSVALIEVAQGVATVERIETPCRGMVQLEADWRDGGFVPTSGKGETVSMANADVKFCFRVPQDERAAAMAAAEALEREWLEESGAASVKLDPETIVETRARAPEIAAATKLEDKVAAFWRHTGFEPGERRDSLLAKLAQLQEESGEAVAVGAGVAPLERLRVKGIGEFVDEVCLDLGEIPGQLIAVHGKNGSGKSTLLGCYPAALFRKHPSYGLLKELAKSRDAFIEATVCNGQRYTIRQTIDEQNGKGESLVLGQDGKPVLASTKCSAFDGWAPDHLPNPDVFYAGVYAAQASGGFAAMKKGERMAVVLRAIGCEHLERLAKGGRDNATACKREADTLQARLDDERQRGGNLMAADAGLAQDKLTAKQAERELATGRKELAQAEAEAAAAEQAERDYQAAQAKRRELSEAALRERSKLSDLEERIGNNRARLAEREQIEAAVARAAEIEAEQPTLRERLVEAELAEKEALDAVTRLQRDLSGVQEQLGSAERRLERARHRTQGQDEVAKANAILPARRIAFENAEAELEQARGALATIQGEQLSGAEERIERLRCGLTDIAGEIHGGLDEAQRIASDTLDEDDQAIQAAEDHPRRLADARAAERKAVTELARARTALEDTDRLAARADDILAAVAEVAEIEREADGLRRSVANARTELEDARQRPTFAEQTTRTAREQLEAARRERTGLEPWLAKLPRLQGAEGRLAELTPQVDAVRQEIARLDADLVATPEPAPPPRAPALAPLRAGVEAAERTARAASSAVAVAERELAAALAAAERIEELKEQLAATQADVADWTRLADTLGRGGLQALEVDAAGPALTELANSILHRAHGPRFSVRIDTQRSSADGKKTIEDCEITVLDTAKGREAPIDAFCGGEEVILKECIALSLSVLACQRAGVSGAVLVRDESGAALDVDNVPVYVAMLRCAAEIVGAKKVLYVSHTPEAWALADARLEVRDGRVTVEV